MASNFEIFLESKYTQIFKEIAKQNYKNDLQTFCNNVSNYRYFLSKYGNLKINKLREILETYINSELHNLKLKYKGSK